MVSSVLRRILGDERFGDLLYFYYLYKPNSTKRAFSHFNGQIYRQRIFEELLKNVGFDVLVETGTYFGNTTEYLARTGLPVYSVEVNRRFHRHAARTFSGQQNQVHLYQDSSPKFLRMLANDNSLSMTRPFFYLDAHWYNNLPLAQELDVIYGKWKNAVALVDDFQVPGTAYTYDDLGPGYTLSLDYLKAVEHLHLSTFFPAAGPEQETGGKRGCIVLAQDEKIIKTLQGISVLAPGPKL
jgi:hypothetical protein